MRIDNKTALELSNSITAAMADAGNLAYIKPVPASEGTGYALVSSDGSQLAVFPSREAAWFTARQHNLEPVSVH